jgi:hypothetical protein
VGSKRTSKVGKPPKDETDWLGRRGGPPLIHEVYAEDDDGNVVEYSLAFIDFAIYAGDNGRVLGYDNAHGFHERHFMGSSQEVPFSNYENLKAEFLLEVANMRGESK